MNVKGLNEFLFFSLFLISCAAIFLYSEERLKSFKGLKNFLAPVPVMSQNILNISSLWSFRFCWKVVINDNAAKDFFFCCCKQSEKPICGSKVFGMNKSWLIFFLLAYYLRYVSNKISWISKIGNLKLCHSFSSII